MAKAEAKTKMTGKSVAAFLAGVTDDRRRRDCKTVLAIMKAATKAPPKMWGPSIVGFGTYTYVYASGRTGVWPRIGFSPRKRDLTLYIMTGYDRFPALMKKLGKYKNGKSCLYVKSLDDIDLPTLKTLVKESVAWMKRKFPE